MRAGVSLRACVCECECACVLVRMFVSEYVRVCACLRDYI